MAVISRIAVVLCTLVFVTANFVTEREWLAKNPGKKRQDYEKLLQAFYKKLSRERAEDHEAELFKEADKDGDGKHDRQEIITDAMTMSGFELHKSGKFMEVGTQERFDEVDKDKDGKITLKEYLAFFKDHSEKDFKRTDANGDGVHTLEEQIDYQSDHQKQTQKNSEESATFYLKHGDKDGDGKLSPEEKKPVLKLYGAHLDFVDVDVNNDGFHSKEEVVANAMFNDGFRYLGKGAFLGFKEIEDFEKIDRNGDKKVTKQEFLRGVPDSTEEMFSATDHNKDGEHTLEELAALPKSKALTQTLEKNTKNAERTMGEADTDKDGRVSWSEYKARALKGEEL